MHQGAWSCASAIHKAHPEVVNKSAPARRRALRLAPSFPSRRHKQGPAHRLRLLPKANKAMTKPPCHSPGLSAATNEAEYSKPQGRKAQACGASRANASSLTTAAASDHGKAQSEEAMGALGDMNPSVA